MEDKFLTLGKKSTGVYKEKGSKFLAFAYPISAEEEIKPILESLKKEFYDARHHCYAYMLGKDQKLFRSNDDGEPNHSAGDPILGQIRSNGLTNVLIVVVRYFGGIKLGVGGLIKAYKTAAMEAINSNEILEGVVTSEMNFSFEYRHTNEVMRIIAMYEMEIISQSFQSICEISLRCQKSRLNKAYHLFEKISSFSKK
ncbi:IMPACT family protein [Lunatibacter salilacus]|uniref:IMPACT family protein n=1 Tax=Lunatibacter salilacus TaxID=2483804 RepID=UPI00131BC86C|nr:YigZ family protein [Lunatibacter salilacus]